jgi:hypothetical protein
MRPIGRILLIGVAALMCWWTILMVVVLVKAMAA